MGRTAGKGGHANPGREAQRPGGTLGRIEREIVDSARHLNDDIRRGRERPVLEVGFHRDRFDDPRFDDKLDGSVATAGKSFDPVYWPLFVERFNDAARRLHTEEPSRDGTPTLTTHTMFFVPIVGPAAQVASLAGCDEALDEAADALVDVMGAAPVVRFVHGSTRAGALARARPGLLRALVRREAALDDGWAAIDAAVLQAFDGLTAEAYRRVAQGGPGGDPMKARILVGFRSHLHEDGDEAGLPVDDLDAVGVPSREGRVGEWLSILRRRHGEALQVGAPESPAHAAVACRAMSIAWGMASQSADHGLGDGDDAVRCHALSDRDGVLFAAEFTRNRLIGPFHLPSDLIPIATAPFQRILTGFPGVRTRQYQDREEFDAVMATIRAST